MASLALPPPPPDKVEQLQQFYKIHDVTLIDEAELILSEHKFEEVAEALRNKYSMLPAGWRSVIGSRPSKLSGLTPSSLLGGLGSPKKSHHAFDFHEQTDALHSAGSFTLGSSASSSGTAAIAEDTSSDGHMGNLVVNEICDTEIAFLAKMSFLREKYVDALYEILGKGEKSAVSALGLDMEQINQVFNPLGNVIRFSRALLDKLEVISLVRTRPRSGRSRAYFVAQAFLSVAGKLHAYAPIITTYKSNLEVITEATKHCKPHGKYVNFLELWEKVSATNDILKGQALQGVLIQPMQRIPRYEMLLKELLKKCEDEETKPLIEKALEAFSSAAKEINEAVRTHEKVSKFFGAGAELKPVRATIATTESGTKIRNEYEVALPKKFQ